MAWLAECRPSSSVVAFSNPARWISNSVSDSDYLREQSPAGTLNNRVSHVKHVKEPSAVRNYTVASVTLEQHELHQSVLNASNLKMCESQTRVL